jgi:thiol-disulfide isomerase/thioredoxin
MLPLGTVMPAFSLVDVRTGATVSSDQFAGKPVLVMFVCNHCPFVVHVHEELARIGEEYTPRGVGIVAICSNDAEAYPDDAPDKMADKAREWGWQFPYLHDADQSVARAFRAACTPDFFLFDNEHRLVYRGQLDDSRPTNGVPVTGRDLRKALDAVLNGELPHPDQKPSIGCSIKWKAGNAPDYAVSASS